ncbi:MAG: methyltransferase domain-containing protein [Saprospiraceae bacterium]|nr:methyltransferase domain-containing protein [Saprospiraceae bacterium]
MTDRWRIAQFFELRWWQRYLSGRERSVYYQWKSRYWTAILDTHWLWPAPGERILDAGCGPAGVFVVLGQYPVDAIDPLLDAYEHHLAQFNRADFPWVRFYALPLEQFSAPMPYDRIYCLNALNHVASLSGCLKRFSDMITPDGLLVCTLDTHRYKWASRVFRAFPGDILHPHQYTASEYATLFEGAGFEIEQQCRLKKGTIFDYTLFTMRLRPSRVGHSS